MINLVNQFYRREPRTNIWPDIWHDTETHKAHAIPDAKIQHANLDAKTQSMVDLTMIMKSLGIVAPSAQPASTGQAKTSIQRELDTSAPPAMQGAQPSQIEDHGSVHRQGDFRGKQEMNMEREISRLRDDLAQCKDKILRLETSAQEIRIASMQEKLDMANERWLERQRFMDESCHCTKQSSLNLCAQRRRKQGRN
jgi:hypothetical protein